MNSNPSPTSPNITDKIVVLPDVNTDTRSAIFYPPVGHNVRVLDKCFHFSDSFFRTAMNYLQRLSSAERNADPTDSTPPAQALADFSKIIHDMACSYLPDSRGYLWLPMSLAAVFDGIYGDLHALEASAASSGIRRAEMTIKDPYVMSPEAVMERNAIALTRFRKTLRKVAYAVHAFIRDRSSSNITIAYNAKAFNISEIDILAALNPSAAFKVLNALLEIIACNSVDGFQKGGFTRSMLAPDERFTDIHRLLDRGCASLSLRGVPMASNTIIGHACLLFIVLTQLDEQEYAHYSRRMGLPDTRNTSGRRMPMKFHPPTRMFSRYAQYLKDKGAAPVSLPVPPSGTSAGTLPTPDLVQQRSRSFDDNPVSPAFFGMQAIPAQTPTPPAAPCHEHRAFVKVRRDENHWIKQVAAKHKEFVELMDKHIASSTSSSSSSSFPLPTPLHNPMTSRDYRAIKSAYEVIDRMKANSSNEMLERLRENERARNKHMGLPESSVPVQPPTFETGSKRGTNTRPSTIPAPAPKVHRPTGFSPEVTSDDSSDSVPIVYLFSSYESSGDKQSTTAKPSDPIDLSCHEEIDDDDDDVTGDTPIDDSPGPSLAIVEPRTTNGDDSGNNTKHSPDDPIDRHHELA